MRHEEFAWRDQIGKTGKPWIAPPKVRKVNPSLLQRFFRAVWGWL